MPPLTRDAVRSANDLPTEELSVPEWGGDVLLKALSLKQRRQLTSLAAKGGEDSEETVMRHAVAMALVDPDGKPMFNADDPADLAVLSEKNGAAIARIFNRVVDSANITKKGAEAAAKN